ncbi:BatA and WFA domain-containing protein [Planctomycetota bacterium]|nr:BatA and WFA domain-containing protein [Planctomycetota bacterium]
MSFLTPVTAMMAAAVAIPTLIVLYFLKLRRRRLQVSSTLLWKQSVKDLQVNSPFQKLKRNLMLFVQLLILIALLIAIARPVMQADATTGQRAVIIIDQSGSMNALDGDVTRLKAAKNAALKIIDNLEIKTSSGMLNGAMIVAFAERPQVLTKFTNNNARLRQAIESIQPTDQSSHLDLALSVIEPEVVLHASDSESATQVYIFSDGHIASHDTATLSLQGADLRYVRIGAVPNTQPDNVAITALSTRRDPDRPQYAQVFAKISNFSNQEHSTSLTLRMNDRVHDVKPVRLMPMGIGSVDEQSIQFDLRYPGHAMLELSLNIQDALPADNHASIMLAPAKQLRVLLVSEGNAYWELALKSMGIRSLVKMTPRKYENQNIETLKAGRWGNEHSIDATGQGFDVIIFDNYAPQSLPPVNSIFMGAFPSIDQLQLQANLSEEQKVTGFISWDSMHPTMYSVVLDDVLIKNTGWLTAPDDAEILATSETGPVIAEISKNQNRYIISTFSLLDSRWPLHMSFPIFVENAVQYLGLGKLATESGFSYRAGEVAIVPTSTNDAISYTGPLNIDDIKPKAGYAAIQRFTKAGIYRTDSPYVDKSYQQLAVNMLNPHESNLRVIDTIQVGTSVIQGESRKIAITHEIWHWFIWGALVFLIIEWIMYTRRMHL